MVFFTGKNGYTQPVDFVPVPDPYPRVRVDLHTSNQHLLVRCHLASGLIKMCYMITQQTSMALETVVLYSIYFIH